MKTTLVLIIIVIILINKFRNHNPKPKTNKKVSRFKQRLEEIKKQRQEAQLKNKK